MALLRGTRLLLPTISQQLRHETLVGVRTSSTQAEAEKTASTVPATQPAEDQQSGSKTAEQEWTEVIDEQSGQTYYWNQKTGETTDLGEPRPQTKFKDSNWEQAGSSGPFQEGWREPPAPDKTYFYSFMGIGIGVVAGWLTQYIH